MRRPISITIISWLFIAWGVLGGIGTYWIFSNPAARHALKENGLPLETQTILSYLGVGILLVCGVAILKGAGWGRWLFLIWGITEPLVLLTTSFPKYYVILNLPVFALYILFLFRPVASEYFKYSSVPEPLYDDDSPPSEMTWTRDVRFHERRDSH